MAWRIARPNGMQRPHKNSRLDCAMNWYTTQVIRQQSRRQSLFRIRMSAVQPRARPRADRSSFVTHLGPRPRRKGPSCCGVQGSSCPGRCRGGRFGCHRFHRWRDRFRRSFPGFPGRFLGRSLFLLGLLFCLLFGGFFLGRFLFCGLLYRLPLSFLLCCSLFLLLLAHLLRFSLLCHNCLHQELMKQRTQSVHVGTGYSIIGASPGELNSFAALLNSKSRYRMSGSSLIPSSHTTVAAFPSSNFSL